MRIIIMLAGATVVTVAASALVGLSVEPATYPWILWSWFAAIVLGGCWACSRAWR